MSFRLLSITEYCLHRLGALLIFQLLHAHLLDDDLVLQGLPHLLQLDSLLLRKGLPEYLHPARLHLALGLWKALEQLWR